MKFETDHWQCSTCKQWIPVNSGAHYCPAINLPNAGATPVRQLTEEDVRRIVREEMGENPQS